MYKVYLKRANEKEGFLAQFKSLNDAQVYIRAVYGNRFDRLGEHEIIIRDQGGNKTWSVPIV